MDITSVNVVLFEAVSGCNLSCIYCYNCWHSDSTYPREKLSTRRTIKMLEKVIHESGAKRIAFTGGEPLLREDLPELIFSVKRLGSAASLLTNGVLLDRSWLSDLQKAGVAQIQLTLLAMDAGLHDLHCGDSHFDRVMAALELLDSMKAHSVINMVVTARNVDQIPEVMRFIASRGQPRFLINRFNPGGNGLGESLDELMLDPAQTRQMLRHAQQGAEELGIEPAAAVPIPPCVVDHKKYPAVLFAGCNAASNRSYFALDPLGNVRACNHSPVILGNVLESPFLEIANSDPVKEWKSIKPAFCEPCPGWDSCKGGCRAAGQQMGLGLSGLDPWVSRCLEQSPPLNP